MTDRIVVLGAGYGGCAAVRSLEDELEDTDTELVWISEEDYHLLLHESHRCIREPDARASVTIPVADIRSDDTEFVQATVTDLDTDSRTVELADHENVDYDYVVVGLGSQTAFYGIGGLEEHALTLKSLGDALAINEQLTEAARGASRSDPPTVVIGGGLMGIQVAGEIAAWADEQDAKMDVHLVERSDQIFPGHDHEFQGAIRNQLEAHDVEIDTGAAMTGVEEDEIEFDEREHWAYMNKGTVVSIGDAAVAHDVIGIPINTFGGTGARIVKKGISARWIESITSTRRAARSWSDM